MASTRSLTSLTLNLPPSCVAFCPTQPQYFVVGTYYLHPKDLQPTAAAAQPEFDKNADSSLSNDLAPTELGHQKRTGSLILFRLDGETITEIATKETEYAILDVQWTPHSQHLGDLLAVAASTGVIAFYRLEINAGSRCLVLVSERIVADPWILVLSIVWHPQVDRGLGITLSNGKVCLCESTEGDMWTEEAILCTIDIHQHELEAWTMAFTSDKSLEVMSGGDDIVLQSSDISNLHNISLLWRDRKVHQAGVTAILPLTSDLIVTGSYDDHIRLIGIPPGGRREVRAELDLGGGVWRLRTLAQPYLPSLEANKQGFRGASGHESVVIVASCMHAGTRIVRLCKGRDGGWAFYVMAKFEEHQSMNYGTDVQPTGSTLKSIVSTSFYDKLLCLWQFDLESKGNVKTELV